MKTAALVVAALMASATPLVAQTHTPWSVPQWTPSRDPLPTWSVPQLPSIGLPLPPIGPAPARPRVNVNEHHGRRQWNDGRPVYPGWPVMFYMALPPMAPAPPRVAEPLPVEAPPAKGSLILRVQPGSAQVWVDGYYAGSADDFSGSPRTLALDAPLCCRSRLPMIRHRAISFWSLETTVPFPLSQETKFRTRWMHGISRGIAFPACMLTTSMPPPASRTPWD